MTAKTKQDKELKELTPIKATLFRFATLRSPQLISEEKKKWGFIHHPDPSQSFFLKNVNTNDIDEARDIVVSLTKTFTAPLKYNSVGEIRKKFESLYSFSMWLAINKNIISKADIDANIPTGKIINDSDLIDIWDNLLYEVIKRKNHTVRAICIQLIVAYNFIFVYTNKVLKTIAEKMVQTPKNPFPPAVDKRPDLFMRRVANAKIVIPEPFSVKRIDTGDTTDSSSANNNKNDNDNDNDVKGDVKLFGVNKLGIAVLRRVEQEVCCYVPGEVSRIENILAREYKERQTRSLISTEDTTEITEEIEVENQTDTVSTTRNELQTEVSNILTKDSTLSTGANMGVSGGASLFGLVDGEFKSDLSVDYSYGTSASESDSVAQTYAQEVTMSALERVLQKTTSKRTSKILKEYEENNRHGFDNREGTEHVTGVYRWVDILYTNRLINYGKRLMFEFLIPEPARLYKEVIKNRELEKMGIAAQDLIKPDPPSNKGLKSPNDLEGYNTSKSSHYQALGAIYDIELSGPSPEIIRVEQSFSQGNLKEQDKFGFSNSIALPTGYRCKQYSCLAAFHWEPDWHDADWYVELGGRKVLRVEGASGSGGSQFDDYKIEEGQSENGVEGIGEFDEYLYNSVGLAYFGDSTYSLSISVTLKCEITPEEYASWQNSTYRKIIEAYEKKLLEYETAFDAVEKAKANIDKIRAGSNHRFNRTVEQREIKRIAIEMLTQPFAIEMGKDFYSEYTKCGFIIPQVDQTAEWKKYSSRVKFFEQAFEWNMITYLFYPYYWSDKCDWQDMFQIDPADDQIFKAFLQSGMARATIPVRLGFEAAINYYLETGEIWNGGGLVMRTEDDLYLSIEEELHEIEGFVEKEWETRVPTTLTIIQGKSVYLDDESLPCCDDQEGTDTLLRGSTALLGVRSDPI